MNVGEYIDKAVAWFGSSDAKLDAIQADLKAAIESKAAISAENLALKAENEAIKKEMEAKEVSLEDRASKKALTIVANQGAQPIGVPTTAPNEKSHYEKWRSLSGSEQTEYWDKNKEQIKRSAPKGE